MTRFIFFTLILLLGSDLIGQGMLDGFMTGAGKGKLAIGAIYETSEEYWAGTEKINFGRDQLTINVFGSVGITDRLDVLAAVPVINGKLQDGSIYLKGLVYRKTFESGLQADLIAGLGYRTPLSSYPTETGTAIGQKAMVIDTRGLIQLKWPGGFFAHIQSGYNNSFDPVPGSFSASAKVGYAASSWYADFWYDLQEASGGKDYRGEGDLAPSSFRELGVSWTRIGGTFYKPLGAQSGAYIGFALNLSGRNTFDTRMINIGWVRNFGS